ncbi:MAG: ribosomal RNA small subunit methyltransferase H [Candidatus Parcubacteria bacterium]|nr:MAG: ribosomal RNA small subunit methyltransferase H [Candidatus Parcubacteria bacterium]
MYHQPVLLEKIIQVLEPTANQNFIDATFGEGHLSFVLAEKTSPEGKILAFEWDPVLYREGLKKIKELKMEKRIKLVNSNFRSIKKVVKEENFTQVRGIVFDLGISNWHYQKSGRGFSFKQDEPLDMRLNPRLKITAFEIINYFSYQDLVSIFKNYGEERSAERIAQAIIEKRRKKKIETSKELAQIIADVKKTKRRIHPATQVFMALRSFINQELENIEKGIKDGYQVIEPGAKIIVLTFNGLEDQIVKKVFRFLKQKGAMVITKNVIRPSQAEIIKNPAARSSKLRAIRKDA